MKILNETEINEIDKEIDTLLDGNSEPVKKKRGRKPKDKKDKYYFSDREENAVIEYIEHTKEIAKTTREMLLKTFDCDNSTFEKMFSGRTLYDILEIAENITIEDKNRLFQISQLKEDIDRIKNENSYIYSTILMPAFTKMVESIMRVFHRYIPTEETGLTFNDTMSFLLIKIDKYDPSRGTKAYSYYGNTCKNYLYGKYLKYQKELLRNPSYDDENYEFNLTNNIQYSIKSDKGARIAYEVVEKLKERIGLMIADPTKYDLKNTEVILGKALINLLENWDYVMSTDGSNKLNKSAVLFFLREQTGLDTKGIRDNMKKYRNEFLLIKNYIVGN